MKICLIQPPRTMDFSADNSYHWGQCRPLSLIYLSAAIRKYSSHACSIVDFDNSKIDSIAKIDEQIKKLDCDIVGITATTMTRKYAAYIIENIKKNNPDRYIVVGGPHYSNCAEESLEDIKGIDFVIHGEGEIPIVKLLDTLEKNGNLADIKGLTYRKDGAVVSNETSDVFEEIDELDIKFPEYVAEYPEFLMGVSEQIPAISIMSSRGCPNHCLFCSKSGLKYRHHSVDTVINEMRYYIDNFNIKAFNFLDLTFTANVKEAEKLCQRIIAENLNVKWWCETRANIPLSLIDIMKKAGCVSIVLGVESGSPRIVKTLKKGIRIDEVENVVKHCQAVGINCLTYFMYSHPGETFEDVLCTLNLISKFRLKYDTPSALQPTMILPGTEIERIAKERGMLSNFRWSADYHCAFNEKVSQLANIPLFMDRLSEKEMLNVLDECKKIYRRVEIYGEMNAKGFLPYSRSYIDKLLQEYRKNGFKGLAAKLYRHFGDILFLTYNFIRTKIFRYRNAKG